jgi:hypothetical protein
MIPFSHKLFVDPSGPLYFLFHGLAGLGSCAPPLSMVMLGAQMGAQVTLDCFLGIIAAG